MPEFTYDDDIFSDLYKDVNGFRPRNHRYFDASPAEKQVIWDDLLVDLEREFVAQQQRQLDNIKRFEALVAQNIAYGAADREAAIQWLFDAEDSAQVSYDPEYFKYIYGLPYSYPLI